VEYALSCISPELKADCGDEVSQVHNVFLTMQSDPSTTALEELLSTDLASMCMWGNSTFPGGCLRRLQKEMIWVYQELYQEQAQNSSVCGVETPMGQAAGTAVGMVGIITDFACLTNEIGLECPIAIIEAIHDSGMDEMLQGDENFRIRDITTVCWAFYNAGCCSNSFINLIEKMYSLDCMKISSGLTNALTTVPQSCMLPTTVGGIGNALPNMCDGTYTRDYTPYFPTDCPNNTKSLWIEIETECKDLVEDVDVKDPADCPDNLCTFGCYAMGTLNSLSEDESNHHTHWKPVPGNGNSRNNDVPVGFVIPVLVFCLLVVFCTFVWCMHEHGGDTAALSMMGIANYGSLGSNELEMQDAPYEHDTKLASPRINFAIPWQASNRDEVLLGRSVPRSDEEGPGLRSLLSWDEKDFSSAYSGIPAARNTSQPHPDALLNDTAPVMLSQEGKSPWEPGCASSDEEAPQRSGYLSGAKSSPFASSKAAVKPKGVLHDARSGYTPSIVRNQSIKGPPTSKLKAGVATLPSLTCKLPADNAATSSQKSMAPSGASDPLGAIKLKSSLPEASGFPTRVNSQHSEAQTPTAAVLLPTPYGGSPSAGTGEISLTQTQTKLHLSLAQTENEDSWKLQRTPKHSTPAVKSTPGTLAEVDSSLSLPDLVDQTL